MSNFAGKITGFIKKHKLERTRNITLVGLALIVACSIFSYLILPAIASTDDESGITAVSETVSTISTYNNVDYTIINNGVNGWTVSGNATDVKIVDNNTVTTNLSVSFGYSSKLPTQHFCIPYTGDISPSDSASTGFLYTPGNSDARGTYTIANGYIYLDIYDKYVDEFNNGITGSVSFTATATRTDTSKNDTTITIGSQEVKIEGFKALNLSITKDGTFDSNTNTVTWTVKVSNPAKTDLNGYTLSDAMFPSETSNITISPENVGTFTDKTFTFGSTTVEEITFTYTYTPTADELLNNSTISNTATLSKDSKSYTDGADVTVYSDLSLEKSGEVVVATDGTKTIKWTVTIKNPESIKPLKNLTIYDRLYSSSGSNITAADSIVNNSITTTTPGITVNNNLTYNTSPTDSESWRGSCLQFSISSDDSYTGGDIVLVYNTKLTDGVTDYFNFVDTVKKYKQSNTVKTADVTFKKSGEIQDKYKTTKSVTWTLSIEDPSQTPSNLKGYVIQDDMLKLVTLDDITVSCRGTQWISGDELKTYFTQGYLTFDKGAGTITINSLPESFTNYGFDFTFNTTVTDIAADDNLKGNITYDNDGKVDSVTNNATVTNGSGTQIGKDSSTVTVPDPTYYKNGNSVTYVDDNTVTLNWTISITKQQGEFEGTSLGDVMSALSGGNHYITQSQLDSLTVYDSGNNTTLIAGTDYTITASDAVAGVPNAYTSFTITFKDTDAVKNLYSVNITYNTTGDVTSVDEGVKVQFDNKATYDKEFSYSQYYTKIDTSYTPYTKNFGTDPTGEIDGTVVKTKTYLSDTDNQTTIGDELYYTFTYVIVVENSKYAESQKNYVLTDTLPDGFSYLDGSFKCYCDWGNGYEDKTSTANTGDWDQLCTTSYDSTNNTFTITKDTDRTGTVNDKYIYTIKIKASDLDALLKENYSFTNSVVDKNNHKARTSTVKFTESDLEKTASFTNDDGTALQAGFIRYSVEFNPSGAQYGDGNTVTLTDIMKAGTADGSEDCAANGIIPTLTSIKVYSVDDDGNKTLVDPSDYVYTLEIPQSTYSEKTIEVTESTSSNTSEFKAYISGLEQGVATTLRIYPSDTSVFSSSNLWFYAKDAIDWNPSGDRLTNVNNEYYEVTLTADEMEKVTSGQIEVGVGTNVSKVTATYNATVDPDYAAKLVLTVPDRTHLIIEYEYQSVRRVDNNAATDTVKAINTVTVESQYKTVTSESDEDYKITDKSQGQVEGLTGIYNFSKVDIGSNGTTLSAGFNLYKYDSSTGLWLPATDFTNAVNSSGTAIANTVTPNWGNASSSTTEASTSTTSATTSDTTTTTTEAAATTWSQVDITSITYNYTVTSDECDKLTWHCESASGSWPTYTTDVSIDSTGSYSTTISGMNESALSNVGFFYADETTDSSGNKSHGGSVALTINSIVINGKYKLPVSVECSTATGVNCLYNMWTSPGNTNVDLYTSDNADAKMVGSSNNSGITFMVATTATTTASTTASVTTTTATTTASSSTEASTSDTPAKLTISDSTKVYLPESGLYKLVEIETPTEDGYSANIDKEFYFTTSNYSGNLPDGITNVTTLGSSGSMAIKNAKTIAVSATKDWLGKPGDSATFELYRSHTKSSSVPSDAETVSINGVTNPVTVDSTNYWTATWKNLPNGDVDTGQPWYYYVVETGVNGSDGTGDYTPYYFGNGLNVTGTVTVYNSSGLTVQKKWYKKDGTELDLGSVTVEGITFKVYRSTTSGLTASTLADGEYLTKDELIAALDGDSNSAYAEYITTSDDVGVVTLSKYNNWQISFKNLSPTKSTDDTTPYYYYVVEDTTQFVEGTTTAYKVEYLNNGNTSSGVITIKNTSTKTSSYTLPATGSVGTGLFFTAGGAIAAIALVCIRVTRQKRRDETDKTI